ncbi:LST8 protein, putative [Trichomonas vaginalis G3]|uniref:LST8 protein, putative n=1 Tax=Trichomonas vaginalis (strain ATCC PRA-98 / G3) TaxID=412133 RepID=A2FT40_TRIV3|nr:TOR signaling [Trichomonas vaginalis G3]EAX91916.1 LST8 protein, putative [Trichomonas vaginalis G3]KAI5496898.1 TOR signaling [Trichomonas vaginalis G3]|eukprot:XP_001304846.1 LST8 protein [Trichomonas vaginalis G3]
MATQQKVSLVVASYDLHYSVTQLNGPGNIATQHNDSYNAFGNSQANRIVPTNDGKFAICANPLIIVVDPKGSKLQQFNGHQTNVTDAVFSDNNFYTCSEDRTIKVWNKTTSRSTLSISTGSALNAIALLPTKTAVVVCNEKGQIEIYDIVKGDRLAFISIATCPVRSMAVTKDGTKVYAATQDGQVHMLNLKYENKQYEFSEFEKFEAHKEIPLRIILSPDETLLVTTSSDSQVRMWDAATGKSAGEFTCSDMKKFVWDAAFTPDGKMLCTAGTDMSARVWDVQTKALLAHYEWHKKGITCLNVITY